MNDRQKAVEILNYILDHCYRKITAEEVAQRLGCGTTTFRKLFQQYFGLPFGTFLRKLRLRQAAQELHGGRETIELIGERNGFHSKKFYSAFREEFGMTPKEFLACSIIPDMPVKEKINGNAFSMEYRRVDDVVIEGYPVKPKKGIETDLLENVAYPFWYPDCHVDLYQKEPQWGIWWHDREKGNELYYLMGGETREEEPKKNYVRLRITGGDYAIFSVKRGEDRYEIAKTSQEMAWYVMKIWAPLNQKTLNQKGYTYEVFDSEKIYLYVPLLKGYGGIEIENERKMSHTVENMVRYIEDHILDNITAEQVVTHTGCSDFFCRDRFQACYQITLPDYIRKKKLYVLAEKLRNHTVTERDLMEKYHFHSLEQYIEEYSREFCMNPKDQPGFSVELPDMGQYYVEYFRQLKTTVVDLEEFYFAGRIIKSSEQKESLDLDVPKRAAYWMEQEETTAAKKCAQIGLYHEKKRGEENIYQFVLGPMAMKESAVAEGEEFYKVEGGTYLAFSCQEPKEAAEKEPLIEQIRKMIRCVDHVWIYDNWLRTDFRTRISFFCYYNGKIYYCVPVYG